MMKLLSSPPNIGAAIRRITSEPVPVPIMIGTGTGSDVMKRMAAPMFGGLLTSFMMELLIYPVIFLVAKQFEVRRSQRREQREALA